MVKNNESELTIYEKTHQGGLDEKKIAILLLKEMIASLNLCVFLVVGYAC